MNKVKLTAESRGELVSSLIARKGLDLDLPCGGNHTCGKCKLPLSGALAPVSPSEAVFLSQEEQAAGLRMACFARAYGEVTLTLPEQSGQNILESGQGRLQVDQPFMGPEGYGAAIDIGTTTVVCALYDGSGKKLAVTSQLNCQQRYGADVISRINHGILHGNDDIHQAIVEQVEELLCQAAARSGVERQAVTHAVVTGNTTMLHFFAGLDPRGIGFVPFIPQSLFGAVYEGILNGISLYIPPCVSAYVGADLVCCLLASDMADKGDTALIVDIGTNGEMALVSDGRLYCCSTAAGPAFEGAGISQGMVAEAGAICHARYEADWGGISLDIIQDKPAQGICGSGVIDTLALLLEQGAISASGLMEEEGHSLAGSMRTGEETAFVFPGTDVAVTQGDVRQIQLAKAAIFAGMLTLAQSCSLDLARLDVLYVCGGFGSFLDLSSAEKIGLIPAGSKEHTVVLGNGAIMGAAMLLLDSGAREKIAALAADCRYIELSGHEGFMDNYIAAMMFGDPEED